MNNDNSHNPFQFIPDDKPKKPAQPVAPQSPSLKSLTLSPLNNNTNPLRFTGSQFSLNRAQLDESDTSLSRSTHVEFEFMNGKCFIKNGSSNGSTFVQVSGQVEIQKGALIRLGENKIFRVDFD